MILKIICCTCNANTATHADMTTQILIHLAQNNNRNAQNYKITKTQLHTQQQCRITRKLCR